MLLILTCLSLLLGMLCPLVSAPVVRGRGGGWHAWAGILLAAWAAGASGILAQRFPDWAVLYLFEANGGSRWLLGVLGASLALGAAWLGTRLVLPWLVRGRWGVAFLLTAAAALACAYSIYRARERILHMATTTFEYRHGLVRPLRQVANFEGLVVLVLIAVSVPSVGVLLLLLWDSLRQRSRARLTGR